MCGTCVVDHTVNSSSPALHCATAERGSIGIAYWQNVWDAYNPAFHNVGAHPTGYVLLTDAWYDPDMDPFK